MMFFIKKHKILILLLLVIALAAFFRFWQITVLPDGLFPDEAANGLDVNKILEGEIAPFFERGNGRESLFFYLLAIPVAIFGRGPWQHHVLSAVVGVLEVLTAFILVRRLFNWRVAVYASLLMAASVWHIVLSRTGFRAILIPLFTTLTFYFLARFFQAKSQREEIWSAILAGAAFGAGFYTYIAYRMMPFILGFLGLCYLWKRRWRSQRTLLFILERKKAIIAFALFFALTIFPLAWYFYTHSGALVGRSGQVSVFSKDLNQGDLWGTVFDVSGKTALSFFTNGDLNWRHNVSGEPFLPWVISPLFFVGIFYFIWRSIIYLLDKKRQGMPYLAVLVWFGAMLLPEITTAEGIPHGLRLIGIIPAIFVFPALILDKFLGYLRQKRVFSAKIAGTLVAIIFIFLSVQSYILYFNFYAGSPEAYYAYRSDLTLISKYLNIRNDKENIYLSLDEFSAQTVEYLTTTTNQPYQLVVPEKSYEVNLKSGQEIIFTQSTLFDIIKFLRYHPRAKLVKKEYNKFNELIMAVYQK